MNLRWIENHARQLIHPRRLVFTATHRLVNGNIDDVRRHTRSDDQVSTALLLEYFAGVFGTVKDAIDIDRHLLLVFINGLFKDRLGDGHTRVGYTDVQPSEIVDYVVDKLLDCLVVGYWASGWARR